MLLYHFTSIVQLHWLLFIEKQLCYGEVPLARCKRFSNGVWLTKEPNNKMQQWAIGKTIASKQRIRLSLEIDKADISLKQWAVLANEQHVKKDYCRELQKTGGEAKYWYVYLGLIGISKITSVYDYHQNQTFTIDNVPNYVPEAAEEICRNNYALSSKDMHLKVNGSLGELYPTWFDLKEAGNRIKYVRLGGEDRFPKLKLLAEALEKVFN